MEEVDGPICEGRKFRVFDSHFLRMSFLTDRDLTEANGGADPNVLLLSLACALVRLPAPAGKSLLPAPAQATAVHRCSPRPGRPPPSMPVLQAA